MSAYLVDSIHIQALVNAATKRLPHVDAGGFIFMHDALRYDLRAEADLQLVGQSLIDANSASVNYRYTDTSAPAPYVHQRLELEVLSPVVVLRLIACYRYQACELPGYWKSLAESFLQALERHMVQFMDGYDDAPWGLDEADYQDLIFNWRHPKAPA